MNSRITLILFAMVCIGKSVQAESINTWMTTEDKINVVVVVASVVLIVMAAWLFRIESRLSKLEHRSTTSKS